MRYSILAVICAGGIAACSEQVETAPLEADTPPLERQTEIEERVVKQADSRPTVERKTAQIDWNAAREDFAARDSESDALVQVANAGAPVVPILLPEEPVGVASAGEEEVLQFRPLADGYFAVQNGEIYDMIINGTDRLVIPPGGSAAATDTQLDYEETMTGAQVSFSRYGASYLVEFMCHDPATAAKGSCISEPDALAEVEKLLIAGTR